MDASYVTLMCWCKVKWQHGFGKLSLFLEVFFRIIKWWRMEKKKISWLVKPCLIFHWAVCLSGFMHINACCLEGELRETWWWWGKNETPSSAQKGSLNDCLTLSDSMLLIQSLSYFHWENEIEIYLVRLDIRPLRLVNRSWCDGVFAEAAVMLCGPKERNRRLMESSFWVQRLWLFLRFLCQSVPCQQSLISFASHSLWNADSSE